MPRVGNRTEVVILQHRRERDHPVGTERLARLGLERVRVVETVGRGPRPELPAGTAVLSPRDDARDLAALAPDERPAALLVLDGTWHHAHRLASDNPWLAELPAVRLDPAAPSRYRLRRQARPEHLSTIESVVVALSLLEPGLPGLDGLLAAFDALVERQLAHMASPDATPRHQTRRPRPARAVPAVLLDHPERAVLVYGETAPRAPRRAGRGRRLVSWCAWRPATGEAFERFVSWPDAAPSAEHLAHMDLAPEDVADAVPLDQVAAAWRGFAHPDDELLAWNAGRVRMLGSVDGRTARHHQLKALWSHVTQAAPGALDDVVAAARIPVSPAPVRGRSALRLGQAAGVFAELLRRAPRMARLPEARSGDGSGDPA